MPSIVRRPFLGEILERASDEQYYNGFDCKKIGCKKYYYNLYNINISFFVYLGIHKVPIQWEQAPPYIREKYLDRYYEYRNYSTGSKSLHTGKINIDQALKFIYGVNEKTCKKYVLLSFEYWMLYNLRNKFFSFHPQDLILHGDISYGVREQFENEAKMALRLANFISAFLQVRLEKLFIKYLIIIM